MKYRLTIFCIVASLLFGANEAQAADGKNHYLILGPGSNSCSAVISDLAEGAKRDSDAAQIIYSMWLAGSLTGYNRDAKATYSILGDLTFQEAFVWTLNYCKENPKNIYSAAVDAFIHEYREDRDTSMPED